MTPEPGKARRELETALEAARAAVAAASEAARALRDTYPQPDTCTDPQQQEEEQR